MKSKILVLISVLSATALGDGAHATGASPVLAKPRHKPAAEMIAGKGVSKPSATLVWSSTEKLSSGWNRLNNKFFRIDYPKCFAMQAGGDEPNPEKSGVIEFERTPNCKKSEGKIGHVSAGPDFLSGYKSLDSAGTYNMIYRQKIKINGTDAVVLAGVSDQEVDGAPVYKLQWDIYIMCSKIMVNLGAALSPGKESLDRIEKKDYAVPEEFKQIASSFHCPKTPPNLD